MSEHETHAAVIEAIRKHAKAIDWEQARLFDEYANRAEAAHKREVDKLTEKLDAAKLCEAMKTVAQAAAEIMERVRHKDGLAFNTANYIIGIANAALGKPARNCNMFNSHDDAWRAYKQLDEHAYFDLPSYVRFVDWLFATAQEGVNDGSK